MFLIKLFEIFLKYFYSILLQNIQKLYDQIILIIIKRFVYFYKNIALDAESDINIKEIEVLCTTFLLKKLKEILEIWIQYFF
jgi:hypothetical protein